MLIICQFSSLNNKILYRQNDHNLIKGKISVLMERIHTEIQTEDRDLVTIPNLYLITNPVKVTRESGAIVSASVSLAYDVSNELIEKTLIKAAHAAKLKEPFVRILELGDFSVSYRISGFLEEVRHIISVRSTLRKKILNSLHNSNIEIVSPEFLNQRVFKPEKKFIPAQKQSVKKTVSEDTIPEELIFDKAEEAKKEEDLKHNVTILEKEIETLDSELKKSNGESKATIEEQRQLKKDELKHVKEEIHNSKSGDKEQ